jgi:hypothetical protein
LLTIADADSLVEQAQSNMTTRATDYADEKQEVQYVEHHKESATDSSLELQKERTMEGIDMNNTSAIKGDDSDGKVEWSIRSIFAAIFLAALYTGKCFHRAAAHFTI